VAVVETHPEFKSFLEADELELACGRERLGDIPAIERSTPASCSVAI
jgi:hypothetical protein